MDSDLRAIEYSDKDSRFRMKMKIFTSSKTN